MAWTHNVIMEVNINLGVVILKFLWEFPIPCYIIPTLYIHPKVYIVCSFYFHIILVIRCIQQVDKYIDIIGTEQNRVFLN